MDKILEFEALLNGSKNSLERFVFYKVNNRADGEDILQEVYITAYEKLETLTEKSKFKQWIIAIANNKIIDFYRERTKLYALPLDEKISYEPSYSRTGITVRETVSQTLNSLADKDKQILYLYYMKNKPQAEIAKILGIPIGTVKSRLFKAKQSFKESYPYPPIDLKGEKSMKKLPDILPDYKIQKVDAPAFPVVWEECMGWFIVPKLGEKISWAMYDIPERNCTHVYDLNVTGKAEVHGIEGVEFTARESSYSDKTELINRTFVTQLTERYCRYLSVMRTENGIRKYITFLDNDAFISTWGFGEDNCGNETHLKAIGKINRSESIITSIDAPFLIDIVGRYNVKINGKTYNTVCLTIIETTNSGVVSEQYLDKNGRTILWRRFNRDDWKIDYYGQPWSEKLPSNEKLTINGDTYVHWYDCITDYIL